ncbi:MAG: ASKHA domain-containing protein [Geminicoccaceae bacterium]
MADDALIVFTPSGKRGRFPIGTPILQAARALGVDIDSVCGGRGICGRCQVAQSIGTFAKHGVTSSAEHLSAFSRPEERYQRKKGLEPGRRLSCSTLLQGDCVIDVPPESQVHQQVVRKRAEVRDIEIDPCVRLYYVEVAPPDMHQPMGDFERLKQGLREQWGIGEVGADLNILQALQRTLRAGSWKVTVAVWYGMQIIAIWPGLQQDAYGIAVDIGSTTMSVHLCSLRTGEVVVSNGIMNPQIRFGEDLMSRVSYVMMNPGGDVEMTETVRTSLNALIQTVCAEAMVDPWHILDCVFVGNPVMHHLFLGIDPSELGGAPFALSTDSPVHCWASDLGLQINPSARAYIMPCIAGHVGADCAAVALSETPYLRDEISLIVDVGTNAEILCGNNLRLLAASSPTGPAFEGAQISAGQRAAPGAIERVRIDRETLEPRFKVIGSDLWSDDDGFFDQVRRLGVTGICGSGIIEAIAEMYLSGIISHDGMVDGSLAQRNARIEADGRTFAYVLSEGEVRIVINQNDVRAIQLAKAALQAGCRLLMDKLGIERVDRIILAGAFGSHIDPLYATVLGLIPDCELSNVTSVGNAAGTGARIALLNRKARAEIEMEVEEIEKIETAVEPRFQEHFVEAMAFPHNSAPYPSLAKAIALPERKTVATLDAGGHGRRRRRAS